MSTQLEITGWNVCIVFNVLCVSVDSMAPVSPFQIFIIYLISKVNNYSVSAFTVLINVEQH